MARPLAALVLLLSDALLAVLVWLAAYKLQNIFTMDTYSHVLPNMQRDAVARLGTLLS
jgi:hypothetical protein